MCYENLAGHLKPDVSQKIGRFLGWRGRNRLVSALDVPCTQCGDDTCSLERGHGDIRVLAAVFLEEDEARDRRASSGWLKHIT
jgi:hypothetical protein